jgi:uncharacterized protein YndB with AHSA1/START domain
VAAPRSDGPLPPLAGGTEVTLPSNREILIVRRFAAPRAMVFDAWTRAEHIAAWWDPRGLPLASCQLDLRPGGAFRFVPRGADGASRAFAGEYREIAPPQRLVFAIPGPSAGNETVGTLVFHEQRGETMLTMTIACASGADRDALLRARVDAGTVRTLENLAVHLARQRDSHPEEI